MAVGGVWSQPLSTSFPELQGKNRENLRTLANLEPFRIRNLLKFHGLPSKFPTQLNREVYSGSRELFGTISENKPQNAGGLTRDLAPSSYPTTKYQAISTQSAKIIQRPHVQSTCPS